MLSTWKPRPMVIAEGVVLKVRNPDWDRPFKIVKTVTYDPKDKNGARRFFLCKFDCAGETRLPGHPRFEFTHFGVAVTSNGIIESWAVFTTDKEDPDAATDEQLIKDGENWLSGFICPICQLFVRMITSHKRMGPEVVRVTYRCPNCNYADVDVVD